MGGDGGTGGGGGEVGGRGDGGTVACFLASCLLASYANGTVFSANTQLRHEFREHGNCAQQQLHELVADLQQSIVT